MTIFDLSYKNFGNRPIAELTTALEAIPPTVTSLNLGRNHLYNKSGAELAEAFRAIPAAELAEALAAIPAGIKKITL